MEGERKDMGKKNLNITVCAIVFAIILLTVSGRTAVYADSTEGQTKVTELRQQLLPGQSKKDWSGRKTATTIT